MAWDIVFRGVDQFLELKGVALGGFDVCRVAESDVFETVDLSYRPEDITLVLALALDTEDIAEVSLLGDALDHVLKELGLGERVLVVHSQMIEEVFLGRGGILVLEQAETTDKVVFTLVSFVADTFIPVSSFL